MNDISQQCIYCERGSDQVPLLSIQYQGSEYQICPQHLPILIHEPAKLAGKLPGAEQWPAEGDSGHH